MITMTLAIVIATIGAEPPQVEPATPRTRSMLMCSSRA